MTTYTGCDDSNIFHDLPTNERSLSLTAQTRVTSSFYHEDKMYDAYITLEDHRHGSGKAVEVADTPYAIAHYYTERIAKREVKTNTFGPSFRSLAPWSRQRKLCS